MGTYFQKQAAAARLHKLASAVRIIKRAREISQAPDPVIRGLLLGALAGGGIGALLDKKKRLRGALIGGGAGLVAGAGAGGVYKYLREAKRIKAVGELVDAAKPPWYKCYSDSDGKRWNWYDALERLNAERENQQDSLLSNTDMFISRIQPEPDKPPRADPDDDDYSWVNTKAQEELQNDLDYWAREADLREAKLEAEENVSEVTSRFTGKKVPIQGGFQSEMPSEYFETKPSFEDRDRNRYRSCARQIYSALGGTNWPTD